MTTDPSTAPQPEPDHIPADLDQVEAHILDEIEREWLVQCGPCDYGMVEYGCQCPAGDYRPPMAKLAAEVRRLRAEREWQAAALDAARSMLDLREGELASANAQRDAVREHERRQAERAILRWAADRLEASGNPEWRPHHQLRRWADELDAGPDVYQLPAEPLRAVLAAIDNALRTGSYMTGANLAFDLLCDRLGVDREGLVFDPLWAQQPGGPLSTTPPAGTEA